MKSKPIFTKLAFAALQLFTAAYALLLVIETVDSSLI